MKNIVGSNSNVNRYRAVFSYLGQLPNREIGPRDIPEIEEPVKENLNPEREFPDREIIFPDKKEIDEEIPDRELKEPQKEEIQPARQ